MTKPPLRRPEEVAYEQAFARALKYAIEFELQVPQGEFGRRVGHTPDQINVYCNGRQAPGIGKALVFAKEAGISLDDLIRRAGSPRDEAPVDLPLDELVPDRQTGPRRRRRGSAAP